MTESEKLDLILSRLDKVDEKLNEADEKLNKVDKLEKDITDIKLTLENEISVNIKRIAEGHLDLSRRLHEAIEINTEKEMMAIRLTSLENEVRRLKQRMDQTA